MVHPVSGGIVGEGKVSYGISVDLVIELEEDTEASMCDDGSETGTNRQYCFSRIFRTPIYVIHRGRRLVELNCKDVREFFDAKRANRHHETSEQSLRIFSLLFIDALQRTSICFVQCLW